jgi:hypothetical protein
MNLSSVGVALLLLLPVVGLPAVVDGIAVPEDVAYVTGWANMRSHFHYEIYGINGISSPLSSGPVNPVKSPRKGFFAAVPGDREIAVGILASAESILPGLKKGRVKLTAHLEAGKLYAARGSRVGDVVTVKIVDEATEQEVSNEASYNLRRDILILIPIR